MGEGARVLRTRRLHGGVASVVHELTVAHASARHRLVLRRSPDRADVPAHDPAREVATEAQVLRALDGRALAPRVIAADPGGEQCGVAALLMTRCPGRPVVAPTRPGPWVRALAEAVRAVRDAGLEGAELDPVAPWWPDDPGPPPWARHPERWRDIRQGLGDGLPRAGAVGVVHRDLHPGNVVIARHRVSGIVDWVHACRGPVEVDVAAD